MGKKCFFAPVPHSGFVRRRGIFRRHEKGFVYMEKMPKRRKLMWRFLGAKQ